MKRTQITVSYTRTQSLQNYSNIKPGVVLGAELDEGDDPEAVKAQLLAEAQAFVEAAVDDALEAEGQAAKFSRESRYRLYLTTEYTYVGEGWASRQRAAPPERLLLLAPQAVRLTTDGSTSWWTTPYAPSSKLRLSHARQVVAELLADEPTWRLVDCADGDLTRLPAWAMLPPAAADNEADKDNSQ